MIRPLQTMTTDTVHTGIFASVTKLFSPASWVNAEFSICLFLFDKFLYIRMSNS